jgi:hypothetical protein
MKRLSVVALVGSFLPLCSFADVMDFVSSTAVSGPGSSGSVGIVISGLGAPDALAVPTQLAAFDLTVAFDPSIIALTKVRFGTQLGDPDYHTYSVSGTSFVAGDPGAGDALTSVTFTNAGAAVDLAEVSLLLLLDTQSTSLTMAILDFTGLAPGVSPLTVTSQLLDDETALTISSDVRAGSFTVTPEPGSLVLLGICLGMLALGSLRRKAA